MNRTADIGVIPGLAEKFSEENNLKLLELKAAGRHANNVDTNILNAAFALPINTA